MLEFLKDLPAGVDGVRATGTVSKEDYDTVIRPLLETAHREGRRLRLLYQFAPEFTGFTAGAGLEDARLGLKYLRLFERCAVVTDVGWLGEAVGFLGTMMPCPVKVFVNKERQQAVEWVSAPVRGTVPHRLLTDRGVLVVEPSQPLRAEDFDALAATVDPWIEVQGRLRGIVVHTRGFPGWENLGSFLRHIRFIRDHHRRVGRIAVAADGRLADIGPALADSFVEAEVKRFTYDQLDDAIAWAGSAESRGGQTP
jgi:stage II sporulation SpoAA-like protein